MITRNVIDWVDNFDRAQSIATATTGQNGWTAKITKTAGAPTVATVSGSGIVLTPDNTNEVQNVCLYQNDILPFTASQLQLVNLWCSVSGVAAASTLIFGMGTARNDTVASVTNAAFFRILGSGSTSALLIDTRDGTISNASIATGATLGATLKKLTIDFTNGLADVRFFVDGARVAAGTIFNMSNLTSTQALQPIFQTQKTAATDVPILTVARVQIQYRQAFGA